MRASTIRLIRAYRDSIDENLRTGLPARSLFMEILRQPRGITHELRRMHRYGILARYLPEFRAVTGRMQYDLFHVFTVDEHTLWVVRNIRRFMVPAFFHEFPLCSEIAQNIPKPELLYIAGLFHDIAKGRGGDHSELGAEDAYTFCIRHGLSEYDSRLVGWLVRRHLLMSMTAQRMDIEDPEVIQRFAGTVGDPVRLDYLYLLTVADVRATNPARWNSWKDSLLRQLYTETQHALMRGLDNPRAQDELIGEKQAEARRLLAAGQVSQEAVTRLWINLSTDYFLYSSPEEIAWQTEAVLRATCAESPMVLVRHQTARGGTAVFICAPDQDGLFALTTALLSQLALNVVAARIQTADAGRTMNTFLVLEEDGSPVSGREREREIVDTLSRGLARRKPVEVGTPRRLPRQIRHFEIPARSEFSQDPANHRTVLHVTATDRPGLLSLVGQAFARTGVRIISAKIATVGALADDTFFITDLHGQPIEDPVQLDRIATALGEHLDGPARAA